MKIDSDKLFDCLDGAEPEQLPMLTDTEKERIYRMSENKFKNNDIHEEKDNGMTVSGVERYSRPVWKRRLASLAAALVLTFSTGTGVYFLQHGNPAGSDVPSTSSDAASTENTTESSSAEDSEAMALARLHSDTFLELQKLCCLSYYDENDTVLLDVKTSDQNQTVERRFGRVTKADYSTPAEKLWTAKSFEELKEYSLYDSAYFENEYGIVFGGRFLNNTVEGEPLSSAYEPVFIEYNDAIYANIDWFATADVDEVGFFSGEPEIIAQYENEISFNRVLSSDTNEDRIINFALRKCDDGVWRTFGIGPVEEGDDTPSELTQETAEALFTSYNRIVDALESPEYTDTDRSIRYNAILGSNKENVSYTYAPFTHPEYHSGEQFEQDVLMTFSEDCREKTFPAHIYISKDFGEYSDGSTWNDNDGTDISSIKDSPLGKIFIIRNGELYRIDASPFLPYYYKDRQPEVTILGQNGKTAEIEIKGEPASNESWLQPFDVTFGLVWEGGNWVINTITPAEGEER